jgi:hypothetical protein
MSVECSNVAVHVFSIKTLKTPPTLEGIYPLQIKFVGVQSRNVCGMFECVYSWFFNVNQF